MSRKRVSIRNIFTTARHQYRVLLVMGVMAAFLLFLIGKIAYWQRTMGSKYQNAIQDQGYNSTVGATIPFQRGTITDRNGTELAVSTKTYNVILDPKVIKSSETYMKYTFAALQKAFGTTQEEFDKAMEQKNSNYYVLYRKQPYDTIAEFKRLQVSTETEDHKFIKGVWFETEYERSYPYKSLASHVIGFVNDGNVGTWGIEQQYNSYLNGTDGRVSGYYDSELNLVTNTWEAIPGNTIVSTIDVFVQQKVENRIAELLNTYSVKNVGVIIMDANNGEILAMASNAGYDLNNPRELPPLLDENNEEVERTADEKLAALNKMWRNFCVNDAYEPGSTFKCLTVAAGLEEAVITQDEQLHCGGHVKISGADIHCNLHSGHGTISLTEAVMKSCNMALISIAEKLGKSVFRYYQTHFGLGSKTGIDLPGEATGKLLDETSIREVELATESFGQGFTVTMPQMVAAYASIVNGGFYYQPHVVKQILNEEGATVYDASNLLVRKTVSAETCEFMRNATYMTVKSGTAKPAQVAGYLVGGKTGTAQKLPRKDKKYVVSFIGSVPANNPQYIIYVVIDEIDDPKMYNSSRPATELTSKILGDILAYLRVYPAGDIKYGVEYTGIIEDDEVNEGALTDDEGTTENGGNGGAGGGAGGGSG